MVKIETQELESGKKGSEIAPKSPEEVYQALKKREGNCAIRGIDMLVFNQQVLWLDPTDKAKL